MTGAWLVLIGRWVFRPDTFEQLVSPTVADLQFESKKGRLRRWRHYAAFGAVLVHAVMHDLRVDVMFAFDRESRSMAWKRAAIWYAGFAALFTCLRLWFDFPWHLTSFAIWPAALTSAATGAVAAVPALAIVPAVVYLYKRVSSRRSIVVATLLVAVSTAALGLAVRPVKLAADRFVYASIEAAAAGEPTDSPRSFRNPDESRRRTWLAHNADELDRNFAWWRCMQNAAAVVPWALIGVVLARRRGWAEIAATWLALFVTWVVVVANIYAPIKWAWQPSRIQEYWGEMLVVFAVALLWLILDTLARRLRRAAAI